MRIFVSYSSRNRPQVKALVQDLENTGHDVWYDQEAAGGHEWWADILDNIRACELFIFALTPESLDSEACRREYRYAHALHKRILPVRLSKAVNPASLTIELQKINFVDYFSGAEQEYRQLVRAITSLKPPVPMPEPMPDGPPVPISPLGEMREKIAARSIGVETQTYLVFELKQYIENSNTRAEALKLLQRLQNHPDMRVGVAKEITTIITPYMPRKLPETRYKPNQSRRLIVGGLVGMAVIIVAVIGLVILLSDGDDDHKQEGQDRTEVALDLTGTPTDTLSPTQEVSPTHTNTSTTAPTHEPTDTPTQRPSETPTATATDTNTPTSSPSPTNTASPTATTTLPPGFEKVTSNAQWQEREDWPIERTFEDGVTMVLVPAGCFDMGSTQEQLDYAVSLGAKMENLMSETPVTTICFDEPFWIDQYEVTQGDFARLRGVAANDNYFSGEGRPRENITWFEARDFCEKRGGRLPTEAQWEYAARGPNDLIFPWGNEFSPENVVYVGNSNYQTAEVGSKEGGISWVGAYDLSGNVKEWVSSLYYSYDASADREDSSSQSERAVRGGSWSDQIGLSFERFVRSSQRGALPPNYSWGDLGFRCARDYNGEPIQLAQ